MFNIEINLIIIITILILIFGYKKNHFLNNQLIKL